MKKELEEKLFKDFPLLYGDRNRPMTETCMCWGCSCGTGWFDLIYELSSKLEPLIEEIKLASDGGPCERCGCSKDSHHGECQTIVNHPFLLKVPYSCEVPNLSVSLKRNKSFLRGIKDYVRVLWKKHRTSMRKAINRVSYFLFKKSILSYKKKCFCDCYSISHPRASQVKEKMGEMKMYLTHGTDEMFDLIDKATEKSLTICENCGQPGKPNEYGWISVLCEECRKK